jgi:hypothetical protein
MTPLVLFLRLACHWTLFIPWPAQLDVFMLQVEKWNN